VRGGVRCAHSRGKRVSEPRAGPANLPLPGSRERGVQPRDVLPVGSLLLCCRLLELHAHHSTPRAAMPAGCLPFALPCPRDAAPLASLLSAQQPPGKVKS